MIFSNSFKGSIALYQFCGPVYLYPDIYIHKTDKIQKFLTKYAPYARKWNQKGKKSRRAGLKKSFALKTRPVCLYHLILVTSFIPSP